MSNDNKSGRYPYEDVELTKEQKELLDEHVKESNKLFENEEESQ